MSTYQDPVNEYYTWSTAVTLNQTVTGTGLKIFTDLGNENLSNVGDGNIAGADWGQLPAAGPITIYVAEVDQFGYPTKVLARCGGGKSAGGSNPSGANCRGCDGDPIDTSSGRFFLNDHDLAVQGRGVPLRFDRTFSTERAHEDGPLGHGWTHNYAMRLEPVDFDATGLTDADEIAVRQENGSEVMFTRDANGDFLTDADMFATLEQATDGSYTFVRRREQTFKFTDAGRLASIADLNGYTTVLGYDGNGRLETVTDEAGRHLDFSYNGGGRVSEVEDPAGNVVSFVYDGNGDLVTATDAAGHDRNFTYNASHWMTSLTDGRGKVTTNLYDRAGRVYRQTDPLGRELDFAYGSSGGNHVTTITDHDGHVKEHAYSDGRLVRETLGAGSSAEVTTQYSYDAGGLLDTTTNGAGKTWAYDHDSYGNKLSETDPLEREQSWTYNSQNRALTHTTAGGVTTTNTWDSNGNLLTSTTPVDSSSNAVTTLTYGDSSHPGDVTSITDAEGGVTQLSWSTNGDLASSTDPMGLVTTRTYNAIGWKLTEVSPRGNLSGATAADHTTTWTRDGKGRVLTVTDPLGRAAARTFDGAGNLLTATATNGQTATNTYDDASQLIEIDRPDASTVQRTYTARGYLDTETDGNGKVTDYGYNAAGLRTTKTDPLLRTTSYTHDAAGRLSVITDPLDRTTTRVHDDAGQLVEIDYEDSSTPDVDFTYDDDGRRLTMVDGSGTTTYAYDRLGHLVEVKNGAGVTTSIDRDKLGRVAALSYPGTGRSVSYAHDDSGRMTSVTDWRNETTDFDYDADGNWTATTHPNGVTSTTTYNRADQPLTIEHEASSSVFASFTQTYGTDGSISSIASTGVPSSGAQSYTRDALQRVTAATGGAGAGSFGYDPAGNLTQLAGAGALDYDDARQLTDATPTSGPTTTYSFNSVGDRTSSTTGSATTTFAYDQVGRLASYTAPSSTLTTYEYDGDGVRSSSTTNAVTREHTWLPDPQLSLLLDDDRHAFVYGPGLTPIKQIDGNDAPRYIHADHLGSARAITDANGAVIGTASYSPYGVRSTTGTSSGIGFAGQYTDEESGLQYLRARYYDPATGQFLTRDPLVHISGDPYGYADGNPIMNTDPTGELPVLAIPLVVAVVVVVATAVLADGCEGPNDPGDDPGGSNGPWDAGSPRQTPSERVPPGQQPANPDDYIPRPGGTQPQPNPQPNPYPPNPRPQPGTNPTPKPPL